MKAALHTTQTLAFILCIITLSCRKELSIENHIATGSLKNSSGICFSYTVHGTFYNGVAGGADTAFVEVKVDVHTTGSYAVFTDVQNGFRLADYGTFNNTGINIIRLKPSGAPLDHVPVNFTIRFDTSVCSLTINVQDSSTLSQNTPPDTLPAYNWNFTDTRRGLTYRGIFENNYVFLIGSFNVLVLSTKKAQAPGDSTFTINIGLPTGDIAAGTYSTDVPPTGIVFRTFGDACVNCAGGGLIPVSAGATVTIRITAYDPVTKVVNGTFSGTTIDWFGQVAAIKDGEFSAVVQ